MPDMGCSCGADAPAPMFVQAHLCSRGCGGNTWPACGELKGLVELLYRQTSLPNDAAQGSGLEISSRVTGNDDCSGWVSRIFQDVVTANDSVNNKSCGGE